MISGGGCGALSWAVFLLVVDQLPHWHGLFLEGGFDRQGRFVHLPVVDVDRMSACFRQRVIAFFLQRKLLNERLAKSMLQWTRSGFSVDCSIRIPAGSTKAREALSQYIVRRPSPYRSFLWMRAGMPWSTAPRTATTSARTQRSLRPPHSLPSSSTCLTHVTD